MTLSNKTKLFFDGTYLTDSHGRCLLTISKKGKVIVERYPDLENNVKNIILKLYESITEEHSKEILSFLNFEDKSFCS